MNTCLTAVALLAALCGPGSAPEPATPVADAATLTEPFRAPWGPFVQPPAPFASWQAWRAAEKLPQASPEPAYDVRSEARTLTLAATLDARERITERAERPLSGDAGDGVVTRPYKSTTRGDVSGQLEEPTDSAPTSTRQVWDDLADCESGDWVDGGASFVEGSARWDYGKPGGFSHPGYSQFHGGLNFHPGTWSFYRSDHHPQYAYDATREQQIEVGERVQADQGWRAWPVCSRKLGLR